MHQLSYKFHFCFFECQDRCYLHSTAPSQHESMISEPSGSWWSNNHLLCRKQHDNFISVAPLLSYTREWSRSKAALSEILVLLCFQNTQKEEMLNSLSCIVMFNSHLKKYSHILVDLVWWMFWMWMTYHRFFYKWKPISESWREDKYCHLHFYPYTIINQSNIIQRWELSLKNNIHVAVKPLDIPYIYFQYTLLLSEYTVGSWCSMSRQSDS